MIQLLNCVIVAVLILGVLVVKRAYKKRDHYEFEHMSVTDDRVLHVVDTREDAIRIRCAAHTLAFNRGCKYRTRIRITDAGRFELSVKRIE